MKYMGLIRDMQCKYIEGLLFYSRERHLFSGGCRRLENLFHPTGHATVDITVVGMV